MINTTYVSVYAFTSDVSLRFIGAPVANTHPMTPLISSRCAWLQTLPSFGHPNTVGATTSSKVLLPPMFFFTRERELTSASSSSPACSTAPWQSSVTELIQVRPPLSSSIIHWQPSPWPQAAGFVGIGHRSWVEWDKSGEQGQAGERGRQGEKEKREERGERGEQGDWQPITSGML